MQKRKGKSFTVTVADDTFTEIENQRGLVPRSTYVRELIEEKIFKKDGSNAEL